MNRNQQIIEDMIAGKIPPPPIAKLLNFKLIDYCDGCTTLEMDIDERYYNPMGSLHGGVMCDLADAAMGTSFFTTLEENEFYTTVDLRINFLLPVKEGKIRAFAKIIKRGRRLGYMECEILNEQNNLVAKASSTCIILTSE